MAIPNALNKVAAAISDLFVGTAYADLTPTSWREYCRMHPKSCAPRIDIERPQNSGCQASRVSPNLHMDLGWFGRAATSLKQTVARFAGVPPIFIHSK